MTIDWAAFAIVVLATLAAAGTTVALYSLGLRLSDGGGIWRRRTGTLCFVVCGLVVIYGVYLIVPAFHAGG